MEEVCRAIGAMDEGMCGEPMARLLPIVPTNELIPLCWNHWLQWLDDYDLTYAPALSN